MLQTFAVIHVFLSVGLARPRPDALGPRHRHGRHGLHAASQGGTHIVERNLTRLTVVVGLLFFGNTILLFRLLA